MNKIHKNILNHFIYFILSFLLLSLWIFKENGDRYFLFFSIVNFLSIVVLLTFGQKYYRTIKEAADKYNREEEKGYCLLCVYVPLYNTMYAGLILIDFVHNVIVSLKKIKK